MSDYPKVAKQFLVDSLKKNQKVIPSSFSTNNNTTVFICDGPQPLYKRSFIITSNSDDEVNFMQATGLAIRFGFMGELLSWFEVMKDWKEGGYIAKK